MWMENKCSDENLVEWQPRYTDTIESKMQMRRIVIL